MRAIVYTSKTGFTQKYAKMLSEKLGIPAYPLAGAEQHLKRGAKIIYCGWICASRVQGYRKAARHYRIEAVCGIGMCGIDEMTDEVRAATKIPENIPLFTLQGGLDLSRLRGIKRLTIKMIAKGLSDQKSRTAQEERMLTLLRQGGDYVKEENLAAVLEWCGKKNAR